MPGLLRDTKRVTVHTGNETRPGERNRTLPAWQAFAFGAKKRSRWIKTERPR